MKIVVLDGYALNPGDLSWKSIEELGDLTVYDRTPPGLVVERAKSAEIILLNKTPMDETIFSQLPRLKYVGVLATGYNIVDVEAGRKRGIVVTNIPTYGTNSVAQMTFALLLELCNHVKDHSDAVHRGEWRDCDDFCFWKHPLIELAGKTIGIIGFGRIGQKVADISLALGMNVIGFDTNQSDQAHRVNFTWSKLEALLKESDVVSLHCPLVPENRGIINKFALNLMKKTAFLINTSRGLLLVEEDVADALNGARIAGAAIDVVSEEPPKHENPLLTAKNCIVTPHISWATKEARERLMKLAVDNLRTFMDSKPINNVAAY